MPSAKEDVNDYEKDLNNNGDSQNEENDQDEGGDILIIGGSDNESFADEDEEEEEADTGSQRSTIQEVLLFAFNFCAEKFDYVKDQILYGLSHSQTFQHKI